MATHHHAPVSQISLPPPHSPSPAFTGHNNTAAGPTEHSNEHPLFYAHNRPGSADMYVHASGAGNEMRKRVGSAARHNGGCPLPNQAEINEMDVAELRQMVSYLICNRGATTQSPTLASPAAGGPPGLHFCSPTSPTFSSSSSYASASSLGTSAAFRRTSPPVRAQEQSVAAAHDVSNSDNHARKRVRHESDTSATHGMGIDLLLNASTISDKIDDYSRRPSSPMVSERGSWQESRQLPRLPPISQLEGPRDGEHRTRQDMPLSLPSPGFSSQSLPLPADSFTMGSVGTSSLNAYKLSGTSARGGSGPGSHLQHFPPPISTTRSQPGICQNPSPPESNHSSPNGISPADMMHHRNHNHNHNHSSSYPSRAGLLQIPSLDATPLPPTGDSVVCSDISRPHHYPDAPATPSMHPSQPVYIQQQQQQNQQSPPQTRRHAGFSFHQAPVLHHGPPTSPRNLYMQAQGYFSHQIHPPPHSGPAPMHLQHAVSVHGHMTQPPQQHHQVHNPDPVPAARNVSKPKFNYAFLDTKRPRGPSSRWTPEEDELLKHAVKQFGEDRQWVKVAQQVPGRSNLQCRQRWLCNIKAQVEKERNAAASSSTSSSGAK